MKPLLILLGLLTLRFDLQRSPTSKPASAESNPANVTDLSKATIDQLISKLPTEEDGTWNDLSEEYVLKPAVAELKNRIDRGVKLTDEQWRTALLQSHAIHYRSTWPVDVPFAVSMRDPSWLGIARISLVPRRPMWEGFMAAEAGTVYQPRGFVCGNAILGRIFAEKYQVIGDLSIGSQILNFNVTVEQQKSVIVRGKETLAQEPTLLWSGSIAMHVDVVKTLNEAIPPIANASVDSAIRNSVKLTFSEGYEYGLTRRMAFFQLEPDQTAVAELVSTALPLKIEVIHQKNVVTTGEVLADCYDSLMSFNTRSDLERTSIGCDSLYEVPVKFEDDIGGIDEWSLRITSRVDYEILRLWQAKRRWNGEIIIPLRVAREQGLPRVEPTKR